MKYSLNIIWSRHVPSLARLGYFTKVEGEGTPTTDLSFPCRGLPKAMENGISTLRASRAFIEVVVHIDSKRVAGNWTFIRVAIDLSCRDVLT